MIEKITSLNNKTVKLAASLCRKSARIKEGLFLIEGDSLVKEAYKSGIKIKYLFINEALTGAYFDTFGVCADERFLCSSAVMQKISELDNAPSVIACGVIEYRSESGMKNGKYILLEDIQDPGNLGAIIRSAAAFDLDGVVICGGCDIYSGKVLRGSMGACLNIPVFQFSETKDALNALKKKGNKIYAAILNEAARKINEYDLKNGVCIAIGNEGNGLNPETVNLCDGGLYIPISDKAESLNAAVPASICIWEMTR